MGYRSENKGVASPVTKYIGWKSTDKSFGYWDKEAKERVEIKMPLKFIALDDFFGVSGGAMDDNDNFWPVRSGIVAHLGKKMVARRGKEIIAEGTWKQIKDKVGTYGGRFTIYTYAILDDELVCFKFAGAAVGAWIEKVGDGASVRAKDIVDKKKGSNDYCVPVFETKELTDKEIEELDASDNLKKFDEYAEAKRAQTSDGDEEEEGVCTPAEVQPDLSEEEVDGELAETVDSSDW